MGKLNDLAVLRMLNNRSERIGEWRTPTYQAYLFECVEQNRDLYLYMTYDDYTGHCSAYQLKVQYTKAGRAYVKVKDTRIPLQNMFVRDFTRIPAKYRALFYVA